MFLGIRLQSGNSPRLSSPTSDFLKEGIKMENLLNDEENVVEKSYFISEVVVGEDTVQAVQARSRVIREI